MTKILFLGLLITKIASAEVLLFSGSGDAEGRTYTEAREYSLKYAHEDAQE
jgi:hypothetical protein